jgi:hypothetical protein
MITFLLVLVASIICIYLGFALGTLSALITIFGKSHTCDSCNKVIVRDPRGGEKFWTVYRADGTFADLCTTCVVTSKGFTAQGRVMAKIGPFKVQLFPLPKGDAYVDNADASGSRSHDSVT